MIMLQYIICLIQIASFTFKWSVQAAGPQQVKTCYDGYTLYRNNLCIQEISEDPKLVCSAGILDGKGCKVSLPKIKRCSEGYTLDASGGCSYLVPSDIQYFCPASYTDNGDTCIQSQPGEIVTYCDEPAERVNDQCITLRRTDSLIKTKCPNDAQLEEGKCWKIADSFECNKECKFKPFPLTCEKKNKQLGVPRSIQETVIDNEDVGSEPRLLSGPDHDELVPASPPRQYQIIVVSQTCARRYEVPPVLHQTCPPNYHLDSKGCFMQDVHPLKTKCRATNGPAESCPRIVTTTEKVSKCANGSPAIKGKCFEIVQGELVEYCPHGYLESPTGSCEGYVEAKMQCAPDLVFRNGKCIGKKIRQAIVVDEPAAIMNTTRANIKELKELLHMKPRV